MISLITFTIGFAAGLYAYRRVRMKHLPRLGRGMVRHTFHVDLPESEMPELAKRDYYAPTHKTWKRVRI